MPNTFDRTKSYAVMIMIESAASKEIVEDSDVTMTIISPAGVKKVGTAAWSGDHYGAGFSPEEKGAYRILVEVETDGVKRETEFRHLI